MMCFAIYNKVFSFVRCASTTTQHMVAAAGLVYPYFSMRDELAVYDGIVFRGRTRCCTSQPEEHPKRANPFVTPRNRWMPTQRKRMPILAERDRRHRRLHISLRCMPNGRDSEPTGNSDEPRHSRSTLGEIGTDLFSNNGKDYLVTVDYYSNFWEVDYLPDTGAQTIIGKLKAHCARHGIPDTIVSDNGPQYSCHAFARFCESWDITHVTSSPYNSKANGKAESPVKTCK